MMDFPSLYSLCVVYSYCVDDKGLSERKKIFIFPFFIISILSSLWNSLRALENGVILKKYRKAEYVQRRVLRQCTVVFA